MKQGGSPVAPETGSVEASSPPTRIYASGCRGWLYADASDQPDTLGLDRRQRTSSRKWRIHSGNCVVDVGQVFMAHMAATKPTSVVLTRAHRDAIFAEIEFAFESACDLPFMLEHAPVSTIDSEEARDLITQLQVAVGLLDQIGWHRSGDRDLYVIEVDEAVNWFAARIESFALAALDYNRQGLLASEDGLTATVRRLIDADLDKLQAARILRTAFEIARGPGRRVTQPLDAS